MSRASTGALCAALLLASDARADDRAHRWFFDGSIGAGFSAVGWYGRLGSGPALSIAAAPAYSRSGSLAWGPALDLLILPRIKNALGPTNAIEAGGVASVSAIAIFRPQKSGVEFAASLGLMGGAFAGYSDAVIAYAPPPSGSISWSAPIGPRAGARFGYVWQDGLGLALSSSAGIMGDPDGQAIIPMTLLGNATYSSW